MNKKFLGFGIIVFVLIAVLIGPSAYGAVDVPDDGGAPTRPPITPADDNDDHSVSVTPFNASDISNCLATKIGNPLTTPADCFPKTDTQYELVKAGNDILAAFKECGSENGYMKDSPEMNECLKETLREYGYEDDRVDYAVEQHRVQTYYNGEKCSECYGYVEFALGLAEGTGIKENPMCAGQINSLKNGFTAGDNVYHRKGKGDEVEIQAGDILVASGACGAGNGHIFIAGEVINNIKVKAMESNVKGQCEISTDRTPPTRLYTVYRRDD